MMQKEVGEDTSGAFNSTTNFATGAITTSSDTYIYGVSDVAVLALGTCIYVFLPVCIHISIYLYVYILYVFFTFVKRTSQSLNKEKVDKGQH